MPMFIAKNNANVYVNGGVIKLTKDQEVKPGIVKKLESESPGSAKRLVIVVPDNFILRQHRWLKVIESDTQFNFVWTILTAMFLKHMPTDKKVGQWCVGKMNKISDAVHICYGDDIRTIPNDHKNTSHNWDGSYHDIIVDDTKLEEIERFIEKKVIFALM